MIKLIPCFIKVFYLYGATIIFLIMPITNLRNEHLDDAQIEDLSAALTQLENATQTLNVNLSAEERSRYGTINEQNKLFVNKVQDYHQNSPAQSTPDLDWAEFEKDFKSRQVLESALARIEAIRVKLLNAKILHDFDNYQAALDDYSWTTYKAGSQGGAYEAKHTELKQFFTRTGQKKGGSGTPTDGGSAS